MLEALGGRKFIFAMIMLVMAFVLVILKTLDPDSFLKFAAIIGGTYVAGNVAATIANK